MAFADGRLHSAELDALRGIARRLQTDAGTFEAAVDWARRHQALVEEAEHLGDAVGTP